ncbi:TetR family transcriptional regulator C-terminal domain-containing protein [Arthrobacter rhombi]|uniref:TetR family transcriptional regulator C-terminal domain-containing protein n=1 Tax=Arthrobacter rhombi TaxID=71253 RepID=UPI003FD133AE
MPTSRPSADTLAERARRAIHHSGLAQRDVAALIGIDETKLSKSLKGVRRFNPEELTLLATNTGVTANWLISGSDSAAGASVAPSARMLPTQHREDSSSARKRRLIIERAWWLFAEKGHANVRVSDIARETEISPASVHYYFPTKLEIFAETLRYSVKLAFDRQVTELHSIPDPVQRLKHLIRLQLPEGVAGRAEWSIWLQTWGQAAVDPTQRDNHSHGYERWRQTVEGIITDGQRSGVFSSVDAADLTLDITSLMDGLGIKVLTGMLTTAQMQEHIENFIDRTIVTSEESSHEP